VDDVAVDDGPAAAATADGADGHEGLGLRRALHRALYAGELLHPSSPLKPSFSLPSKAFGVALSRPNSFVSALLFSTGARQRDLAAVLTHNSVHCNPRAASGRRRQRPCALRFDDVESARVGNGGVA
jgi:hypothetical protein